MRDSASDIVEIRRPGERRRPATVAGGATQPGCARAVKVRSKDPAQRAASAQLDGPGESADPLELAIDVPKVQVYAAPGSCR